MQQHDTLLEISPLFPLPCSSAAFDAPSAFELGRRSLRQLHTCCSLFLAVQHANLHALQASGRLLGTPRSRTTWRSGPCGT